MKEIVAIHCGRGPHTGGHTCRNNDLESEPEKRVCEKEIPADLQRLRRRRVGLAQQTEGRTERRVCAVPGLWVWLSGVYADSLMKRRDGQAWCPRKNKHQQVLKIN